VAISIFTSRQAPGARCRTALSFITISFFQENYIPCSCLTEILAPDLHDLLSTDKKTTRTVNTEKLPGRLGYALLDDFLLTLNDGTVVHSTIATQTAIDLPPAGQWLRGPRSRLLEPEISSP
jgi:hypothetical protein